MDQEKKFRSLLDTHAAIIYKICRVYTDNAEDFNDFYQEVALQLWRSYQTFRGDAQLSTW
ncbi:MAG: RNA polymerase sigma factor, partial [Flammeovirgaceae bacterium]